MSKKNISKIILLSILLCSIVSNKIYHDELNFLMDEKNKNQDDEVILYSIEYNYKPDLLKTKNNDYNLKVNVGEYDTNAPAYLKFTIGLEKKGWDFMALSSYQGQDSIYSDDLKAYAMGFLEGAVTAEKIWNHYQNQKRYYFFNETDFEMPKSTRTFLEKNAEFIREKGSQAKESEDPYWYHANLIHRQLEGMLKGYNSMVDESRQLKLEDLNVCNARGDLTELSYYNPSLRPNFSKMTVDQILNHVEDNSHCSALIKIAPDFSDVWFGHNTWTNFSSMMRIFKEYRFKSNNKSEKSKTVAFSGYPGVLSSIDDFYITDQDLFVTETTNSVFKTELYDLLTPESLLTWIRSILANRLSSDAKTWTDTFALYNSGTYNNQFQILDLKKIDTEKQIVEDGAFRIIETMPGKTMSDDMTNILRYGYWPSYNSAYFSELRTYAGYDEQLNKHPELKDSFDYATCARAKIFRRDQHTVKDMDSYKKILRYNDYKNDPFSKNNPSLAIACRGDLDEKNPNCRGATDAKVCSIHDIKGKKKKIINIISGPTHDTQEPFDVYKATCVQSGKYQFKGLPKLYNFGWITYETTLFDN
jgi:hypothetical protein